MVSIGVHMGVLRLSRDLRFFDPELAVIFALPATQR